MKIVFGHNRDFPNQIIGIERNEIILISVGLDWSIHCSSLKKERIFNYHFEFKIGPYIYINQSYLYFEFEFLIFKMFVIIDTSCLKKEIK